MESFVIGKRSKGELKRLVEEAVAVACGLPRPGLWFGVEELETSGSPTEYIRVWATLHFTAEGSPFCCGEPQCHLGLFAERLAEIGDQVRRAMGLRQAVSVEFVHIGVQYHAGVGFHYGQQHPGPGR
jgi:hypothetical protein